MKLYFTALIFLILFNFVVLQPNTTFNFKEKLVANAFLNAEDVSDEKITAALKEYQKQFKLPVTGNYDDATNTHMHKCRCGKPANGAVFHSNFPRWSIQQLTYQVTNIPTQYNKSAITAAFDVAIAQWTKGLNLQITQSTTNTSDINIAFCKQDGVRSILGYALEPINGSIYLDQDEDWTFDTSDLSSKIYIGWVAAHELGHALGLAHNEDSDSIMNPYYSNEVFKPSDADYNNLKNLYGLKVNKTQLCEDPKIDAIIQVGNERHVIFKQNQLWIWSNRGIIEGPFKIKEYLGSPSPIDAGFLRNNIVYVLKDNLVYKIYTTGEPAVVKKFSTVFPNLPTHLDAAFYNPTEKIIYLFKRDKFYRFNVNKNVQKRLSKSISISIGWNGIPDNIEAATLLENNVVLFIKGSKCYFYDLETKTLQERNNDCRKFYQC